MGFSGGKPFPGPPRGAVQLAVSCRFEDLGTSWCPGAVQQLRSYDMRFVSTSIAAAAFALLSTGIASAAVTPDEVLDSCPTSVTIGCSSAVRDFVDANDPGRGLNEMLVKLARELAYRAKSPATSLVSCLEIRDGIRAAAEGVSLASPRSQLRDLAAGLCASDDAESDDGLVEVIVLPL
jgi:hypothetical protein